MKTKKTLLELLAALAVLAVIAAGCGSDDTSGSKTTRSSGNKTDAAFITDMTAHHQGAIDMAKVALAQAKDEDTRTMARMIIEAQEKEIAEMQAWLKKHAK